MSIVDRIKRRLPIVGAGGGNPSPPAPTAGRPAPLPRYEEEEASSARGAAPVSEFLASFVKANPVVLFMKGSPDAPLCGFSANAAGILRSYGKPIASYDVISDPEVRQGIKEFSNWPTIPQIYIGGEFLGGSDILMQMHQAGELRELIEKATAPQG